MGTALTFSQILFYLTFSVTALACMALLLRLAGIANEIVGISRDLRHVASEAGERVGDSIYRLSQLPILAYFLRDRKPPQKKKGRETKRVIR